MSNGFKQYDYPIGPTPESPPTGSALPGAGGGGWLSIIADALGSVPKAVGAYFTRKAEIKAGERDWQRVFELERMRIEAKKELERMRRTLDPAIYAMLKKELLRPRAPHGMGVGAGRPQTGAFREMVEPQRTESQMPTGRGGQGFNMNRYLTGGGR